MQVKEFLEKNAGNNIKDIPVGIIVIDMAEIVLNQELDNCTGQQILDSINASDNASKDLFLNKEISTELKAFESWSAVKQAINNDMPKRPAFVGYLFVTMITILTIFFGAILGYEYLMHQKVPDPDAMALILGLPVVGMMMFYGVSTDALVNALLSVIIKRVPGK